MHFMLSVNSGLDMKTSLMNLFDKKDIRNIRTVINCANSFSPDEIKKLQIFHSSIKSDKIEEKKGVNDYSVIDAKRKLTLFQTLLKKDKLENEVNDYLVGGQQRKPSLFQTLLKNDKLENEVNDYSVGGEQRKPTLFQTLLKKDKLENERRQIKLNKRLETLRNLLNK